jgi:hypothetical protein
MCSVISRPDRLRHRYSIECQVFPCSISSNRKIPAIMTSIYPNMLQPSWSPNLGYQVLHHRNCGHNGVSSLDIDTFITLQEAQRKAQDDLVSALHQYITNGWNGYYCNDIDLDMRGLVTRLVTIDNANGTSRQAYDWLSEVHIYAVERLNELFHSQLALVTEQQRLAPDSYRTSSNVDHNHRYGSNTSAAMTRLLPTYLSNTIHSSPLHPPQNEPQPYSMQNAPDSFAQTRSPWLSRPDLWTPAF